MSTEDYIYVEGRAVESGQPVENDFVYSEDGLLRDGGRSTFAFIEDQGLGGGGEFSAVLYSPSGSELSTILIDGETTYQDGGIGWRVNGDGDGNEVDPDCYYDYAHNPDNTSVVYEDFESGDLSGYSGAKGSNFAVGSDTAQNGTYSLKGWSDARKRVVKSSPANEPTRGDPIKVFWKPTNNIERDGGTQHFQFALQENGTDGYGVGIRPSDNTWAAGIVQDGDFQPSRFTRKSAPVDSYIGQWLYAVVRW